MSNVVSVETLKEIYKVAAQGAMQCFERDGEVDPQIFMISCPSDKPFTVNALPANIVQFFFRNTVTKSLLSSFIRESLNPSEEFKRNIRKNMGENYPWPDVIVQISEAWKVVLAKDVDPEEVPAPSKHPDRTECVICSISTPDQSFIGMMPIVGNPRRLQYEDIDFTTEATGRLTVTDERRVKH